ncbi:MAG: S-layer homology domain-containing protein [Candidatus Gracilibacteria bacterium]
MKKFLSTFLLLCIASTSILSGESISEVKAAGPFSDVDSSNTYYDALSYLQEEGILKGNPDGTFKPYSTLNRAEFVTIIVRAQHLDTGGCSISSDVFPDVGRDQWYAASICYAYKSGLVTGYPDGTFRPTSPISFVEAAKILTPDYLKEYYDYPANPWYEAPVEYLESESAIPTSISSFDQRIIRGEMAEILYRTRTSGYRNKYGVQNPVSLSYEQLGHLSDQNSTYSNTTYGFSFQLPNDLQGYKIANEKTNPFEGVGFSSTAEPIDADTLIFYMNPSEKPAATELFRIHAVTLTQKALFEKNIENTQYGMGETTPELLTTTNSHAFFIDMQSDVASDGRYTSTFRKSTWGYNRIKSFIQNTVQITQTGTTSNTTFTLSSSNEQLQIWEDSGSGYCEGDRLYKGTYTISVEQNKLNIGEHTFLGGGENACDYYNEEHRKVDVVRMDNGKLYGFAYSESYKAKKVIAVVYDPQSKILKQVNFYDENGQIYNNTSLNSDTLGMYSSNSEAEKNDKYITFHTYPCCGSAGFYGEEYFQPADSDPSILILRKFTTGQNENETSFEDGGVIEGAEPQDAALATVYRFYRALRYADGAKAVQEVVPEKRETGAYKSSEISDTYSSWNLAMALHLIELKKVDSKTISVVYKYATDTRTCEDKATVSLRQDGDKFFIEKIVPEKGC